MAVDLQGDMDELARQSVEALKAYFGETEPDRGDETRAKVAASVLSTAVRLKQTMGARDALRWNMAHILLDKESLKDYVRVSMPGEPIAKALPEGKAE